MLNKNDKSVLAVVYKNLVSAFHRAELEVISDGGDLIFGSKG